MNAVLKYESGLKPALLLLLWLMGMVFLNLLTISNALAQVEPIPDWVKKIGGNGESKVTGIAVDPSNNVYVAGDFRGNLRVDFSGTSTPVLLSSQGDYDIFIAKYSPDGRLIWAKGIGGSGWDQVNNLAVDKNGNPVMSCYFQSSIVDCDPGPGIANYSNLGGSDAVVIKLNTNGEYAWARSVSGSDADFGNQAYFDPSGNVIFTGSFRSSSINLGTHTLNNRGETDGFIAKYDPDGNLVWAFAIGGSTNDELVNVTTDSNGEIIVIGYFSSNAALNPLFSGALTSINGKTQFVCKYTPSGFLMWANKIEGPNNPNLSALSVNSNNEIFISGVYTNQITLNAQSGAAMTASNPGRNLFLGKYSPSGNPLWTSNVPTGSPASFSYCIVNDRDNNIYMSGYFEGGLTFGSGASVRTLTNSVGRDTYCARFNSNGSFEWAFNFGSTCSSNYAHKVAVDAEKKVLIGGMFCNTVDFNPGNCTLNLTASHFVGDGYLAKFDQVNLSTMPTITAASLPQQTGPALIDAASRTITIDVLPGTNLTQLLPQLKLNIGSIFPASETEVDLSSPKTYTISSNCLDYIWTLKVTMSTGSLTLADAGADISVCGTNSITLAANAPGTGETGTWSVAGLPGFEPFDATNMHNPNAVIDNLPQNVELTFIWTIENPASNTSSTDTMKFFSQKDLNLEAPASITLYDEKPVNLGVTADLNPNETYDIQWLPKHGLSSYTTLNPEITLMQDITYTLTISYGLNCSATATVKVLKRKSLEIPNSFSPNGDGTNDTWEVKLLHYYPGSKAMVFNRYGQQVYLGEKSAHAWDGTYGGKPLPTGTYYYVITVNDTSKTIYKGSITILR